MLRICSYFIKMSTYKCQNVDDTSRFYKVILDYTKIHVIQTHSRAVHRLSDVITGLTDVILEIPVLYNRVLV